MPVTVTPGNIDVADTGSDFASAVKTEITKAAADLAKMSEKDQTETITGAKTFQGNTVEIADTSSSDGVVWLNLSMTEIETGNTNPNGFKIVKSSEKQISFTPVVDGTDSTGVNLVYKFDQNKWKFSNDAIVQMNNLVTTSNPPASASATGDAGTITWDSNYIYICVAANTWKRVAIATW